MHICVSEKRWKEKTIEAAISVLLWLIRIMRSAANIELRLPSRERPECKGQRNGGGSRGIVRGMLVAQAIGGMEGDAGAGFVAGSDGETKAEGRTPRSKARR